MNTSINKALVAIVGGAILLVNTFFNTDWVVSEQTLNAIVGVVTPLLVWLVPNKAKPAA